MSRCPHKERKRQTQRDKVKAEAEITVRLPETKEHLSPPEAGRGKERRDPLQEVLEEIWPYQHLDFGFLESRL